MRVAAARLSSRLQLPVLAGFASAAQPTVASAVEQLRRRGVGDIAVLRYVLAPGRFADDIENDALAAGAVAVAAPLGAHPAVAELVVRRYQDAVAGPVPRQRRMGTRACSTGG